MPMWRFARVVAGVVVGALAACVPAAAQTPFTHQGADAKHAPYGLTSGQVDPASGNLTVVVTDLVLPGNAGFNLAIQRVYNSSVFPDYNEGQSTVLEEDSWAGIGWKLHFGRVIKPDSTVGGETQIEMGDGSRQAVYSTTAHPEGWMTSGFGLYDKSTHTLKLPNGVVYTFGHPIFLNARLGTVRYVTEIRDAFNNRVTFSYFDAAGPPDGVQQIQQHLSATEIRTITFTYDPTHKALQSMAYNGRTCQYTHQAAGPPGHSVLTNVQPPMGPAWQYGYASGLTGELTSVTTPGGGQTTYAYTDATRRASTLTMLTRVVSTSAASGPDVPAGTWTFAYGQGSNQDTTVVTCPCGTTRYRYYGVGLAGTFAAWSAGTLAEIFVEEGGALLERRTFSWAASDPISADDASGEDGIWTDTAIYRPLLTQESVHRGPHTWTTTYEYHLADGKYNDYGRPWRITENGHATRTTTRTFQYGFAPYIVDRTAVEETRIGQQIIPSNWTYDLSTGFLLEETLWGIRHRYELGPGGNVGAYTDAANNRTAFTYAWGQVQDVTTPHTHVTNTINADGTVAATTNHVDYPTNYDYDELGRVWRIRRTGVNSLMITYDNVSGRGVNTGRGATQSRSTVFDGFGRAIRTGNLVDLKTRTVYDACGRVSFESLPYTTETEGQQGTSFAYDALGRLRTVTAPGNRITSYTYDGLSVTRTDPEDRTTIFSLHGFGGPGTERLVAVQDAAGVTTSYEYDVTGTLSKVTGPGPTPPREWVIAGAGLILSETHPESGTTTYEYWPTGTVKKKTDALGQVTQFTYNGNNQLLTVDAPGTADDVTFSYDAAGRMATMAIAGVTTTLTPDLWGRIQSRADNLGTQTFTSSYGYDGNENLSSITYPSGRVVTYQVGTEDRLASVTQNGAAFAQSFQYDGRGNLASYQTGAVTHTLTADAFNRLQRIQAGTQLDLTYSYDDVGNVSQIVDPRVGMTQTFTYDALDRLTSGVGPWGQRTWTYDEAGNRLTEGPGNIATYSYHATTRRLSSIGGANPETFAYNALGQLTQDARGTYQYNIGGLLKQFTGTNVSATYGYDAAGLRLTRSVNSVTFYTVRGAANQTLSEYEAFCGTPVWTRDAIYAGGRLIGAVKAVRQTASVKVTNSSITAAEGTGSKNVTLKLTTSDGLPLACAVTAAYVTSTGTAAPGLDFGTQDGTAVFAAGTANNATRVVTIPIAQDTLDEADETLALNISSVMGGVVGTPSRTDLTITDDDATPTLSIADLSLYEGNSATTTANVTVTLSAISGQTVTVQYASSNGTATAGSDYTTVSGTLTIPAGSSSGIIAVPVLGEGVVETNETLTLTLTVPSNATIADGSGVVTILNDDAARNTWGDFYAPRDGAADAALFNPASGNWTFKDSNTGNVATFGPFGNTLTHNDLFVPADYTGDGITDCATYRPATGVWTIAPSCLATGHTTQTLGGVADDVPVPADYDGDAKADVAIYRRSTGVWHILKSTGGSQLTEWGWTWTPIVPTPGDFDGDGKADLAYYAAFNQSWWILQSSTGTHYVVDWGISTETVIPAQADYDGDGRADTAFYRPWDGYWYIVKSTTGLAWYVNGGLPGATVTPVSADYDADGKIDPAFYEPGARTFYIVRSTTGTIATIPMAAVSAPGDLPVLKRPQ
jgi:YD repeat-containing protein